MVKNSCLIFMKIDKPVTSSSPTKRQRIIRAGDNGMEWNTIIYIDYDIPS